MSPMHRILSAMIWLGTASAIGAADPQTGGLIGRYYPTTTPSGTPVLTRTDAEVNFTWGSASPDPTLSADNFSVCWSGYIVPNTTGELAIVVRSDDGVRLRLNGVLVVDGWTAHAVAESSTVLQATAGRPIPIALEYFEQTGLATAQLYWQEGDGQRTIIPATNLIPDTDPLVVIPAVPDGTGSGLQGSYFANETLSGAPVVTRLDPGVNFGWASSSPAPGLPADGFSVRWSGSIEARKTGPLILYARSDDGVRMWIDGVQVISDWRLRGASDSTVTLSAVAGRRYDVVMEMYEHTGLAEARLEWREPAGERTVVPTSQLYPTTDTSITMLAPATSFTSPACVHLNAAARPTLSAGQGAINMGGRHWYADVPLDADASTAIAATLGSNAASQSITWVTLPLSTVQSPLTVRRGDAIRVAIPPSGVTVLTPQGSTEVWAGPETHTVTLSTIGSYQFLVDGQVRLSVDVVGFPVDLHSLTDRSLALHRNRTVTFTVTADGIPPGIVLEASPFLTLNRAARGQVSLSSSILGKGALWFRLATDPNAILFAAPVTTFDLTAVDEIGLEPTAEPGSTLSAYLEGAADTASLPPVPLRVTLRLTPYIPDLRLEFSRFAHRSTFLGGVSEFTVFSDGSPSSLGESGMLVGGDGAAQYGEFSYTVYKPRNEVSTCVRVVPKQVFPDLPFLTPSSSN